MEPTADHASKVTTRVRLHRQRKREGIRVIKVQVFNDEIAALIAQGLLSEEDQTEGSAIAHAIERLIEEVTSTDWVTRAVAGASVLGAQFRPPAEGEVSASQPATALAQIIRR